jgi:hypothetical protein
MVTGCSFPYFTFCGDWGMSSLSPYFDFFGHTGSAPAVVETEAYNLQLSANKKCITNIVCGYNPRISREI